MPVEHLKTDPNTVGQRIDNFLIRYLKGVPRQLVYRILRRGEVRVNGRRVKPTYRLQLDDDIRIPPVNRVRPATPTIDTRDGDRIEQAVLHEDQHLIAINKPAGIAVHGGSANAAGVIEILRASRGSQKLELAHRIDRDTSGILVICKNRPALVQVQQAFRERTAHKIYETFVQDAWPARKHTVQAKLLRYKTAWGERRVRVDPLGKSARTDFRIIDQAPHATRLEAVLHTGRTHQIRVHAKASGHPIIGDRKYGPHEGSAPRLCLHACRLRFNFEGHELKLQAPLPDDLDELWSTLKDGARLD